MFRRRRPPILAELPAGVGESARPGALSRAELEPLDSLLKALGDTRVVLATGVEAKSALALGLATAAAAEGRRTALIECDLVLPSLAASLGLDPVPGLREYLRLEAEASQVLQPLTLAGPASGRAVSPLACVVGGGEVEDGLALLDSEGFRHAVAKLRNAYDLLVFDGPPLDEVPSLLAVAARSDTTLACGPRSDLPRRPKVPVDGLVIQV
jgi:Mrp family chromosome partitioning ATPase